MESNLIKVAVKVRGTCHLTELDINRRVEDIVRGICDRHAIPYEAGKFALRIQDFSRIAGTDYVTDENKTELRHGRQLKLSKSARERAATLIDKLHTSKDLESSIRNLENIGNASKDAIMVNELMTQNVLQQIRVYASVRDLSEEEFYRMYMVMSEFLRRGSIETLCVDEVNHLMEIITCERKAATRRMLILAFEILIQLRRNGKLYWPSKYLSKLTLYVRLSQERKLQEKSLNFINCLYLHADDETETANIFAFMKSSVMITHINKYVIREDLPESIKHQLYIYQNIILRKYIKRLEAIVVQGDNILDKLEYVMTNMRLVDRVKGMQTEREAIKEWKIFENIGTRISPSSTADVSGPPVWPPASPNNNNEYQYKMKQRGSDLIQSATNWDADYNGEGTYDREKRRKLIPILTLDSLYYHILNDYEGFKELLLFHGDQLNSLLSTSIEVTTLLCQMFQIPETKSAHKKGKFVPLCFLYHDYFVERMFCLAMKLYHRSRSELGVAVDSNENSVVLKMVRDQLSIALDSEPMEFPLLENVLKNVTVKEVLKWRERMVKEEINRQLTGHPAFVQLREMTTAKIQKLIQQKRMRFMEVGEHVYQFDRKGQKIPGKRWFLQLSAANNTLTIEECPCNPCSGHHKIVETVLISKIKEIESGRKSNFHKEVQFNLYNERDMFFWPGIKQQEPDLKFPISLRLHELVYVDFSAGSELTMNYWVDGLRFLIGEKMNSRHAQMEMDYLMDIELMEHLASVDGLPIPENPPPVPPDTPRFSFDD